MLQGAWDPQTPQSKCHVLVVFRRPDDRRSKGGGATGGTTAEGRIFLVDVRGFMIPQKMPQNTIILVPFFDVDLYLELETSIFEAVVSI